MSAHKPEKVLLVDRKLVEYNKVACRKLDYAIKRAKVMDTQMSCEWLDATDPSYILYTSGTTGKSKSVQSNTGGYAVALATFMVVNLVKRCLQRLTLTR